MRRALHWVKLKAKECNLTVAIPSGIGCGNANGDWKIVYKIIEDIFKDSKVKMYVI